MLPPDGLVRRGRAFFVRRAARLLRTARAASAALALSGCAAIGPYVWIDDVPLTDIAEPSRRDYAINTGDLLSIRVYNQDAISTRARVRPDGRIAVPLAGEVDAVGRRPLELAKEIEAQLKPFVVAPAVVVSVDEVQPVQVSVLGEVTRPGVFPIEQGAGVLQALALAGGTTRFARRDRIFVLRKRLAEAPLRVRFTYEQLSGGSPRASSFTLVSGDVVSVE